MVSKGRSIVNQRVADDQGVPKRVGVRDFKIYSDTQKIKLRGSDRVAAQDAKTAIKPLMTAARKSLSTDKGINLMDPDTLKATVENSENWKGKRVSSVNIKERKVLADISNVRSSMSKSRASDGSKLASTINEGKNTYMPRVSVGQTAVVANGSSRKSVTVCIENLEKCKSSKQVRSVNVKVGRKVLADVSNVKSYLSKTRVSDVAKPVTINGGRNVRKPRVSVGQTTTYANASSRKPSLDHFKCSEEGLGNSVKVKIRRKVVPGMSNARGSLWKNRASDSFISMKGKTKRGSLINGVPVGQAVVDVKTLSKRSLKPTGKTTLSAFSGQMTSKSKCASTLNSSTSATVISLKKKGKMPTNVVPKNVAFVVSQESNLEKPSSDENSNSSIGTTDIISKTKSIRRRSFTSSLVARSELLGESGKVIKQEKLPNIDDNLNPLEVAVYIDDIYQYYWVMEVQYPSMASYMDSRTNITPKMRGVLVNWLIEVHFKFELMPETLFLMVGLFDRFLSEVMIETHEIQLVGLTALLLASKYEDFWHPRVRDLISVSAGSYTSDQMLAMEKLILEKLMFRLNIPTPYVFMLRFLKAAQSDSKLEHLSFYLIELCLVEYEALNFKASLLSASAIYVARCTLQMTPAWTPLLCKHARYKESQLRACANMISKFQKVASTGPLTVTYEKYMHPDLSRVSVINAMDRLPQ